MIASSVSFDVEVFPERQIIRSLGAHWSIKLDRLALPPQSHKTPPKI